MIAWKPSDPTLKPWVKDEAARRGITERELLDEALAEYREKLDFARSVDTANREIRVGLSAKP